MCLVLLGSNTMFAQTKMDDAKFKVKEVISDLDIKYPGFSNKISNLKAIQLENYYVEAIMYDFGKLLLKEFNYHETPGEAFTLAKDKYQPLSGIGSNNNNNLTAAKKSGFNPGDLDQQRFLQVKDKVFIFYSELLTNNL